MKGFACIMKIISVSRTPSFEARIKLKAPNVKKIKEVSVKTFNKPETKKVLASSGVSLVGTATVASGYNIEPDKLHPSVQSVEEFQGSLCSLGTTVTEIPVSACAVGGSNELSGTTSSASVENFLFDKNSRDKAIAISKKNLESLKDPNAKRNMIPYSAMSTAAGIEYSGVAPAGSVESLVSGADVAELQASSQIAGMILLAPPASSALASAFKELESAESSKSFLDKTFNKPKSDKKLPS